MPVSLERIGSLLIAVGGACLLYRSVRLITVGLQSEQWPTTPGRIVSLEVREERTVKWNVIRSQYHSPAIRYEYLVDDTAYVSNVIAFSMTPYFDRRSRRQIEEEYPIGKIVAVHYNPRKPEVATLQTGSSVSDLKPLGIGILLSVVGLLSLISSIVG
jgi:hypothetical protein